MIHKYILECVCVCVCEVSYVAPKTPYVELLLLKGHILPGGMAQ